uniref:Uncharacterized protein n=1 Tax=Strigamia maritima TaxID=126957 RepID=T1JFE6_STRMM
MKKLRQDSAQQQGLKHWCEVHPFDLTNEELNISTIWQHMSLEGILTRAFDELIRYRRNEYKICFSINPKADLCFKGVPTTYMIHNSEELVEHTVLTRSQQSRVHTSIIYGVTAKQFKGLNRTDKLCETHRKVSQCERDCLEAAFKQEILCKLPSMLLDVPFCTDPKIILNTSVNTLKISTLFDYSKNCACPSKCEEIMYTDHLKMIEWTNKYPSVCIYFDDDIIETIEEFYSYTFIPFICDVGGNLGLFLGLCIPTMFEIIESVVLYFLKKM